MAGTRTIVVARRFGRLANRLTSFAQLIAWSREHGDRVVNPTMQSYAADFGNLRARHRCVFPPPQPGLLDRLPGMRAALRRTRADHHVTKYATALYEALPLDLDHVAIVDDSSETKAALADPAKTLVLFRDWSFRAPDLVTRHADAIRSFLRPASIHIGAAADAVGAVRERADVVVGVHIRHGDYATYLGGRYFFEIARYAAWMEELATALAPQSAGFVVCSDARLDPSQFPGLTVGFGPGSAVGDLYALAACDLLTGPVSTFSQWASFYGNAPLFTLRDADSRPDPERFAVSDLSEIPGAA